MGYQAISERVATLRKEIATLHRANELYMEAVSHTLFEIHKHMCRVERLEQIMLELAELAGRRGSSPAYPLARKRQDWAA